MLPGGGGMALAEGMLPGGGGMALAEGMLPSGGGMALASLQCFLDLLCDARALLLANVLPQQSNSVTFIET